MTKVVAPTLGARAFSCPHCGAFADQSWFGCWIDGIKKAEDVQVWNTLLINRTALTDLEDDRQKRLLGAFLDRLARNPLTYRNSTAPFLDASMENMHLSWCRSCSGFSVWVFGALVYPKNDIGHPPNEDMPADVRAVFEEAASIVSTSPRGSAALLRLAVELLMPHLQAEGANLNAKIGNLVKRGMDPVVQKALDVVRVTGNNAVHPGQIDLTDDPESAAKLFGIVNLIVATMISAKKQIAELFENLPEGAKAAIERRDS